MSVNDGFLSIIVVDEDTIIHDVDQLLVLSLLLFDIIELFVSHINDLSRQGMTLSKRGVFCARIIKIAMAIISSIIIQRIRKIFMVSGKIESSLS